MELFKPFHDCVDDRHRYAKDWKAKTGGKVIGYFCTYVPEEIIYAAGMLPVRIIGNNESQTITDEYCSRNKWCPFSRNCLAEGLRGHYDYLDGLVIGASCFHTQASFLGLGKTYSCLLMALFICSRLYSEQIGERVSHGGI